MHEPGSLCIWHINIYNALLTSLDLYRRWLCLPSAKPSTCLQSTDINKPSSHDNSSFFADILRAA